mgnify:CR=1 FL=1
MNFSKSIFRKSIRHREKLIAPLESSSKTALENFLFKSKIKSSIFDHIWLLAKCGLNYFSPIRAPNIELEAWFLAWVSGMVSYLTYIPIFWKFRKFLDLSNIFSKSQIFEFLGVKNLKFLCFVIIGRQNIQFWLLFVSNVFFYLQNCRCDSTYCKPLYLTFDDL